jgi:integrase
VLSDDEIRTLWWGLDRDGVPAERHVCLAIRMILTTMVRPYQAAGAQICEFADLGTASALYDMPRGRAKKDRAVIVPLSDFACAIIDEAIQDKTQKVLFPSKFDETGSTSIARASISQALNGKTSGKRSTARPWIALGFESSWAWRTSQPMICAGPRRRLVDALVLHGPTSRRCLSLWRGRQCILQKERNA